MATSSPSKKAVTTTNPIVDEIDSSVAVPEVSAEVPAKDLVEDEPMEDNDKEEEVNPYAYLERNEFSSEHFKIEVKGLPKFFGFKEVKKLLNNKLRLNSHKIKPGKGFMFVTFKNEEDKQKAVETLNGYVWKNKTLSAEVAKAVQDPLIRKRKLEQSKDVDDGAEKESIEDTMRRVTTPWWNIPYEEQLQKKMETSKSILKEMTKKVAEVNPKMVGNRSQLCPIEEIKRSPVMEGYRNKCEFSIGYHPDTNEKMVGFRASSYKAGSISIGPISHLNHLPEKMVKTALAFQDYVRASDVLPFDPESHIGFYKQLTVRTTSVGEVMMFLIVSAKEFSPEKYEGMKQSLTETFSNLMDPKITSFYIKATEMHGQQQKNAPELLFGQEYITERLLNLNFRISSEAFFQINRDAAEVLYNAVGNLLEANSDTTLLDVCCGTGTIGIAVAAKCGQVVGIEMVESAVCDARKNAELNGLAEKCQYIVGKAEDVIEIAIAKSKFQNIVAIVDPPRSGLHQRVLTLLRSCEKIKRLIYVACDARLAMKNFIDLCRPVSKTYKGAPFEPTVMIPVDMFPNCHQVEIVIQFDRQE